MDKMKEQLKQNQTQYDELHKMLQALTQQMLAKPEVKPIQNYLHQKRIIQIK